MAVRDLACAGLGWLLAIAMWVGAARLPRSLLSDEFGADGMPRGLAIALAAVSTLIAVRALWRSRAHTGAAAFADEARLPLALHARALGMLALGLGYVLLAPGLGYIATATLLIAATAWYYGARPTPAMAAIALAGAVLLWAVFAKMLGVAMPAASWLARGLAP